MVHPQSIQFQQEKAPTKPLVKGQRTAKYQWLGSTAGTCDEHENSPTHLLSGLTDGLVSRESSQLLRGACQDNTALQEPIQKSGFRREVSLIDDDFVNYADWNVAKSGILKCHSEKQMVDDISLSKYNEL
ncbi:mitogen-activated protein kinase kinase kinase [Sarracenia purpurea var. burkii]